MGSRRRWTAATLIGNGIGRFAYTPLIPALIAAGWFTPGRRGLPRGGKPCRLSARRPDCGRITRLLTSTGAIHLAALATVASLVACAWPLGFAWYAAWRLLAGVTGGVLMVLAVPAVLAATPPAKRGRAAGVVITGIGLGIAMAGTVVPAVAQAGPTFVWLVLAAMAFLLTIMSGSPYRARGWNPRKPHPHRPRSRHRSGCSSPPIPAMRSASFRIPCSGSTISPVDLGAAWRPAEHSGSSSGWALQAGPFLAGVIADRCGLGRSYVAAMAIKAMAVALPLVSSGLPALFVSSFMVGALIAGTTTLCSAWIAEQVGLGDHRRIWGWMTSAFAVAQAAGAWALSLAFAATGSYALLFTVGAASLATGAALAFGSLYLQRAAAFRGV